MLLHDTSDELRTGILRRLPWSSLRIAIVLMLASMAAAVLLFANTEREHLARVIGSYENIWVSHQLLVEYQQLDVVLVRAENGDPSTSLDEVQMRLDVLAGRVLTAQKGQLSSVFGDDPVFQRTMAALDDAIAEADQIMAGAATLPLALVARRVHGALALMDRPIQDLRLSVRTHYGATNDAVQRRLQDYLNLISVLLGVGAVGLFGFGWLYARQHDRLRRSELTFRTTFDRAGVGIGHLSVGGQWQRVNATLCRLLGGKAARLRDDGIRVLLPELADFTAFIAPLLSGEREVLEFERAYRGLERAEGYINLKLSLVRQPTGEPDYVILIMEDTTERRSIEAQLRQAQKMESVGQLTGGIAHDFNNLLGVIVGNLDMLSLKSGKDAGIKRYLHRALDASERAAALTGRLLAFSRRQTLMPQSIDVNRLVRDMMTLLASTIGDNVVVRTDLAPCLIPAMVDPGQLEAALVNLAINARDAMSDGGVLEIMTGQCLVDDDNGIGDLEHGAYVIISVRDTGIGIAPEALDRIFEPFFTTKEVGKGTGLGLSMVYGFVKQSGGHVQVESTPGSGTIVRLYLPAEAAIRAEAA